MRTIGRVVGVVIVLTAVNVAARQDAVRYQGPAAESFLTEAPIVSSRAVGTGITRPRHLTLRQDGVVHDALFKHVDERRFGVTTLADGTSDVGFQDSWQTEIAAYVVDRVIGLGMVPATVERRVDGNVGSVQWWLEPVMPEAERVARGLQPPDPESWNRQAMKVRLFDELIANVDRHGNNLLVTPDFDIRLVDHSRSFRPRRALGEPERLTRFSRSLLDGLRRLERRDLGRRLGRYLDAAQIDRLLDRRDAILALAAQQVALRGEPAVLYH